MQLRVLGCAGGSAPGADLSCYLLDDVLAVDAGALTTTLDFKAQRRVQDVLLTHGHLEANDIGKVFEALMTSQQPFDQWFREKILVEAHGMDPASPPPPLNQQILG